MLGLNIRNSTGSGINAYGSDHIEILENTTFDTHSSGIKLRDCGNVMVSGNSVRRAVNGGTEECITISSCVDFEVCHNSVTEGVGLYEGGEGICVKGNASHGSVHHNAVHDLPADYDPAVHEAGEVGIYIESVHPDDAGFVVMNNILSGNRQYQMWVREVAMVNTTLASNLIHGPFGPLPEGVLGMNPVVGDPLFVNPPVDLSLQSDAPALGMGLGVDWLLADYLGRPMRQPPDLGAIQYIAPNSPPVLLSIGNRSVRAGEPIRIGIQAHDADSDTLQYTASGE